MIYELVKRGYARPAQTGQELLDSFPMDVMQDIVWFLFWENGDEKQQKRMTAAMDQSIRANETREQRHAAAQARMAQHRQRLASVPEIDLDLLADREAARKAEADGGDPQ